MFDNLFNLINRFLHPLAEEYLSSLDFWTILSAIVDARQIKPTAL